MSKMVDMCQPHSMNFSQCFAGRGEVHIIDGTITETINKIDQTPADTPDTLNVKFHRPNSAVVSFGAKQNRLRQSIGRIFLSNRKGAYRWSMYTRERLREAMRLVTTGRVGTLVREFSLNPLTIRERKCFT